MGVRQGVPSQWHHKPHFRVKEFWQSCLFILNAGLASSSGLEMRFCTHPLDQDLADPDAPADLPKTSLHSLRCRI